MAEEPLRQVEAPAIVTDDPASLEGLIAGLEIDASTAPEVFPASMELFRNDPAASPWVESPGPRALAIGQPAYCAAVGLARAQDGAAGDGAVENGPVENAPVENGWALAPRAVESCLKTVSRSEADLGVACQCRLVAVDDLLLVAPRVLQFSNRVGTHVYIQFAGAKTVDRSLLTLSSPGLSNFASGESRVTIQDDQGNTVCSGERRTREAEASKSLGAMTFRCIEQLGELKGNYSFVHESEGWGLFANLLSPKARVVLAAGVDNETVNQLEPALLKWFE